MAAFSRGKAEKKTRMGKKHLLLCTWLFAILFPSVASGEEAFDPVRVIYMINGETIQCQMASIEGIRMVCRKANGSVSLPLQNIDFEKTFPKYKNQEGETLLLVHAGQLYRDENTIVSNLRMIRMGQKGMDEPERLAIFCDVINRAEPCDIRVSVIAKDGQGNSRFAIDIDSESRVGKGQRTVLKKPLAPAERNWGNHITTLRIGDVDRRNIQRKEETVQINNGNMSAERLREQRLRSLKESFLK